MAADLRALMGAVELYEASSRLSWLCRGSQNVGAPSSLTLSIASIQGTLPLDAFNPFNS